MRITSGLKQFCNLSASAQTTILANGRFLQMSVPFIPIQDITIGRCLGEGSEGVVYAGSYLETPVAIKQLSHVQEMEMNLHVGEDLLRSSSLISEL